MTSPIKHFYSGMAGAPTLNGLAGSMIGLLDACLVNGFNLLTLDSLVVASNVLTGTKASHGYVVDQVILVAGANESALNGEWTITTVTSSTFSAAAPGVGNTTGTGTISSKAAPARPARKPFNPTAPRVQHEKANCLPGHRPGSDDGVCCGLCADTGARH